MHSNSHTMDSVSMKHGCIFTIRHLVSRAEGGVILYNLLVLSPVLQLPPLAVLGRVDGVVFGVVDSVVDGVVFGVGDGDADGLFDFKFLHIRVQRLESQSGQTKSSICLLSFLLWTMLLHYQPLRFVQWRLAIWRTEDSLLGHSCTAWFSVTTEEFDSPQAQEHPILD